MTTISLPAAKRLCTTREYALVLSSRPRAVRALTDRALRAHRERARKARDAFRDKARTQRREQRGTVRPRGSRRADGNQRTVEKEKLFAQVLAAFITETSRRKAAEKPARKKAPQKPARKKAGRTTKRARTNTQSMTRAHAHSATKPPSPSKPKPKPKPKTKTPPARAAGKKKRAAAAAPTETAARAASPPSPGSSVATQQGAGDHGMEGNRAAIHQPIPAITRRGRSLLATDISGKQSMKRIPRAQRRARYGSISALGRRNQARRDSRG